MSYCIDHNYSSVRGYATTTVNSVRVSLHRLVYASWNNILLEELAGNVVRHTCDNPRCVNPEHLVLGTQADNMQDRVDRQRPTKRKLAPELLAAIYAAYRTGKYTHAELRIKFKCSASTVSRAIRGTRE